MDNRDICSLVEDLLPMYAEGLVSDKTKIQIEKHIDNLSLIHISEPTRH